MHAVHIGTIYVIYIYCLYIFFKLNVVIWQVLVVGDSLPRGEFRVWVKFHVCEGILMEASRLGTADGFLPSGCAALPSTPYVLPQ